MQLTYPLMLFCSCDFPSNPQKQIIACPCSSFALRGPLKKRHVAFAPVIGIWRWVGIERYEAASQDIPITHYSVPCSFQGATMTPTSL